TLAICETRIRDSRISRMEVGLCRESCKPRSITCCVQHDFSSIDGEVAAFADEGVGTDLPATKYLECVSRDCYVSERNRRRRSLSILFTSHGCDSRHLKRSSHLHGYVRHVSRRCQCSC